MKPQNTESQIGVARVQQYIRSRFNPIRSATPEMLAQYLDQFKVGYLRQPTLLWDAIIERDDLLSSVVPKRCKSVSRNQWEVCTVDNDEAGAAEAHAEALTEFWNNITCTDAVDENDQGEVSLLVRQMMSAQAFRYCVHEIVWQPGSVFTAQFRRAPIWFFENTTGKLRYIQTENGLTGVDMDPAAWSVACGDGLMPACSVAWMYKSLSLKDWVIYNERHGMPGIHGKTSASEGTPEWQALVTAVENFASDWSIVTNEGATIEKIDLATQGQLPYPPLVERMDRAMAAIWRGADLSTISAGKGDGSGASLQGDEGAILEEDDCRWISETLRRNVDRLVIEYRFGRGVKPLAYFNLKPKARQDVQKELSIDTALHGMGMPVSISALAERYGRPLPAKEDDTLPAKPAPLPIIPNSRRSVFNPPVATVAKAMADDLAPLRNRIEHALALPEREIIPALMKIRDELPDLLKSIGADPETAKALESTLAKSIEAGIKEAKP